MIVGFEPTPLMVLFDLMLTFPSTPPELRSIVPDTSMIYVSVDSTALSNSAALLSTITTVPSAPPVTPVAKPSAAKAADAKKNNEIAATPANKNNLFIFIPPKKRKRSKSSKL